MTDKSIVVAIGRNVGDTPMSSTKWELFKLDVDVAIARNGTIAADVDGSATCQDWAPEQAYWVAGSTRRLDILKADLRRLARSYGQDAIALTVGETELLEAS